MEKRPVDETAEWENGHPMADNKDQQPLTSNGTTQQNDQEKLDEKAKLATDNKDTSKKDNRKKGHPITENNDPQTSTSGGTIQQNETKSLPSESPQLAFISNSYYSSDHISPNHEDTVVPKECIKHFVSRKALTDATPRFEQFSTAGRAWPSALSSSSWVFPSTPPRWATPSEAGIISCSSIDTFLYICSSASWTSKH